MKLTKNRRLPPIINIESFVKVVELGGISAAAGELSLTQSAISRHVIDLEKHIGRKLLIRTASGMAITEDARHLATKLASLLADMNSTFHGAAEGIYAETVRICASPIFCINFLSRNANTIMEIFKGDVEIISRIGTPDLYTENVDIAVITARIQPPEYPGKLLFTPIYYPYIATSLVPNGTPLVAEDFPRFNLLNHFVLEDAWTIYFREIGLQAPARPRITFSLVDSALAAILGGQGIGFLPDFVAREHVQAGVIRRFHDRPFRSVKTSYFLVYKKEIADDPRFREFEQWLGSSAFR